jgi:SpoIIAA-like
MVERIDDMPAGTVGLRASGRLTREDYRDVLVPVLREAVESGEVRMLFVLTDFEGLEPSAWPTDVKTGLALGAGHHSAWKRLAFVTDAEWVRKAMHTFAWLIPGELMICEPDQLEKAKTWVAA